MKSGSGIGVWVLVGVAVLLSMAQTGIVAQEEPDDDVNPTMPRCSNYKADEGSKQEWHTCHCKDMLKEGDCEHGDPKPGSTCKHWCAPGKCGCVGKCTT